MQTTPDKLDSNILLVDDERNILTSLKRLLRPLKYNVHMATSGAEGLTILEENPIDVVISDMRMPEMDGAEFLDRVNLQWPDTIRILLTGYSDIGSTIKAVNKGKIFQYIAKPWQDEALKTSIEKAMELAHVRKERDQLLILTRQQNDQLSEFNLNLERKVEARTEKLKKAMKMLDTTHKKLKSNYFSSIKTFSSLVELRGVMGGRAKKIADLAQKIAAKAGFSDDYIQQIVVASLLHNVGKLSLPDSLLKLPVNRMAPDELAKFQKHPIIGESVLMGLDSLSDAAKLIRSQHELYDGTGYPDHLKGSELSVGSTILSLCIEYYELLDGKLFGKTYSSQQALDFISQNSGKRYHSKAVKGFMEVIDTIEQESNISKEKQLTVPNLLDGMVLARDLVTANGMLLLSKGQRVTEHLIGKLFSYEKSLNEQLDVYIQWHKR